jgi:Zn-dependent M28 family amino/carboxypeptidase
MKLLIKGIEGINTAGCNTHYHPCPSTLGIFLLSVWIPGLLQLRRVPRQENYVNQFEVTSFDSDKFKQVLRASKTGMNRLDVSANIQRQLPLKLSERVWDGTCLALAK